MAQLGKRSRPPSMSRITSIVELGSLCDNPSVVGPGHDPAALGLQQKAVAATAAAAATATSSSGRARKQRQTQAQHTNRRPTGSAAANSGLCCWPPAAIASGTGLAHGAGCGTVGFAGAAIAALEPAQFLRACGLCNRRLGPGKDTYMYRGDMAFCSTDCRDLRIAYDERGATCSFASGVPQATAAAAATAAAGSRTAA